MSDEIDITPRVPVGPRRPGHPRRLSRRAHPEAWAKLTRMRRLRRATQRMSAWQGYERLAVSKLFKKLRASGIDFAPEGKGQRLDVRRPEQSYDAGIVQKGKGLLRRIAGVFKKGGDR